MATRKPRTLRVLGALGLTLVVAGTTAVLIGQRQGQERRDAEPRPAEGPSTGQGQTATRLPDGRWLVMGTADAGPSAWIWDPRQNVAVPTPGQPALRRRGHSATLLSDGSVLIVGGWQDATLLETPEVFDPGTGQFAPVSIAGSRGRAAHTATVLTDERVLVIGGSNGGPDALPAEIWDLRTGAATQIPGLAVDQAGHAATLTADGHVELTGGRTSAGTPVSEPLLIDIGTQEVRGPQNRGQGRVPPHVSAATPANGANGVALDAHVTVRFSDAVAPETITSDTLSLVGPGGPVPARIISAEQGRLAFVWPAQTLDEGATYVLNVAGSADRGGVAVVPASISFRTLRRPADTVDNTADLEGWVPLGVKPGKAWQTGRARSPWESLEPLMAPPGVTAISGRVLTLNGRPLEGVTFTVDGIQEDVRSDRTGRFLLPLPAGVRGRAVLEIEGESANRSGRQYGFFEYGATVTAGETTVLPFTIWMPTLDTRNAVKLPSPTTSEVVVATPHIPGLELHIPAGTVIRDEAGQPVTEISITPVPADRPPFPLVPNVETPVYFTIQPGGSYVHTYGPGAKGAWLVYPNYESELYGEAAPGQQIPFVQYDPHERDWYVYGLGRVSPDGQRVLPDPTTRLYAFTGSTIEICHPAPAKGPIAGGPRVGEPVDPSTGIFVMEKTDLYLPDVIPLALTRVYQSGDTLARPFGRGMTHPYEIFLWSADAFEEADLFLADGSKIHYVRTSPGIGYVDATFSHEETETTSATPTRFYKSAIVWNGTGWDVRLTDGTVYVFAQNAPLQAIRDRFGNTVTISRSTGSQGQMGNITRITSPNGRWIAFTYDGSNRITEATDNTGRSVTYTYASGNLSTVTDPEENVTTYTWTSNLLDTIEDAREIVYLDNTYTDGRLTSQTLWNLGYTFEFDYTVNGSGQVTQTDVTNPRDFVTRFAFNADGYVTTLTEALGEDEERTTTFEREEGSNFIEAVEDELERRTEFTYDSAGRVLTKTLLAGTADAVTTSYTYEPLYGQLASATDPLDHTWTMSYDSGGKLEGVTDPLTHETIVVINSVGQVTSVTDALSHSWQFGYLGGDLISMTDPLSAVRTQFVDLVGRVIARTDPLGRVMRLAYDDVNQVTAATDAQGAETTFAYDPNGNLTALTDALSHTTSYVYDSADRVTTRTDPLTNDDLFEYDANDNLVEATDRAGQVTTYTYDALDRLVLVTYDDTSSTAYTWDAGDRLIEIDDSVAGVITREYDDLDRLIEETSPEGTVTYTYDDDGRRETLTVDGQTAIEYTYDDAHRLTEITRGAATVTLTYDNADRRETLTYPNGIVVSYSYDNADRLTGLSFDLDESTLGTLTYTYDAAGNRTSIGGTWARTGLPDELESATYDAANRLTDWDATSFTYDDNGNLTSDGTNTYSWNARQQLTGLSGGASASFSYDGAGRRRARTISSTTTNFLYDGLNLVQELLGSTPTANFLTGLGIDEVFTRTLSGGTETILADALGSTLALADGSGDVATEYTYAPFGETSVSGTSSTHGGQFTGRENDGTGLYYYRARYYHPVLQRFIGEDPIGFAAGDSNLYGYVFASPTNYTDPTGEAVPWVLACVTGAAWNLAFPTPGRYGLSAAAASAAGGCAMGLAGLGASKALSLAFGAATRAGAAAAAAGGGSGAAATSSAASGGAQSAANAVRLSRQLAAQEIAGGHAFKHAREFADLGITTRQQFANHIERIMNNPSAVRQLTSGRTAFWDDATGTVVIRNPSALDGGTAFRPTQGMSYFTDNLR